MKKNILYLFLIYLCLNLSYGLNASSQTELIGPISQHNYHDFQNKIQPFFKGPYSYYSNILPQLLKNGAVLTLVKHPKLQKANNEEPLFIIHQFNSNHLRNIDQIPALFNTNPRTHKKLKSIINTPNSVFFWGRYRPNIIGQVLYQNSLKKTFQDYEKDFPNIFGKNKIYTFISSAAEEDQVAHEIQHFFDYKSNKNQKLDLAFQSLRERAIEILTELGIDNSKLPPRIEESMRLNWKKGKILTGLYFVERIAIELPAIYQEFSYTGKQNYFTERVTAFNSVLVHSHLLHLSPCNDFFEVFKTSTNSDGTRFVMDTCKALEEYFPQQTTPFNYKDVFTFCNNFHPPLF